MSSYREYGKNLPFTMFGDKKQFLSIGEGIEGHGRLYQLK
jgi:hypothetical protein